MSMQIRVLGALEARVLAVLVEKQHTVPDSYPLSLNSLVSGCNQKTAREPVMSASDQDVLAVLADLKALHLVGEVSGARVVRFDHNMARVLKVPGQSVALLTLLILRGPQTAAELRLNTERLHKFADISSVEGFLDELAEQGYAVKLPRAPGAREARWAHLLCGEVTHVQTTTVASEAVGELVLLREDVARLAQELSALRTEFNALKRELTGA